jgi:trk system potassium uptake protein TrkA
MMNFVVARAARSMFNVPNVVARVYDPNHYDVFTDAGLQTVISSSWSANRMEQLLTHPGTTELASLGHRDLVLIEVRISPKYVGEPVSSLMQEGFAQPVALVRSGQALFLSQDTLLEEGDLVAMLVSSNEIDNLQDLITGGEV